MRVRLLLPVVLVVGTLTACSGGGKTDAAATLPPVSPSASASASPSPTGLVPPEATAATPAGATAFAKYFLQSVTAAYFAKDPERIRRLSDPSCSACARLAATAQALRDNNTAVDTSYTVDFLDVAAPGVGPSDASVTVLVVARFGPFVVRDMSGRPVSSRPGNDHLVQNISLSRTTAGQWTVKEISNA
jgi:hypothetical protein